MAVAFQGAQCGGMKSGFRYHAALVKQDVLWKPCAAYAIGAALVDTEIQVSDAELEAMNVEKGMMTWSIRIVSERCDSVV